MFLYFRVVFLSSGRGSWFRLIKFVLIARLHIFCKIFRFEIVYVALQLYGKPTFNRNKKWKSRKTSTQKLFVISVSQSSIQNFDHQNWSGFLSPTVSGPLILAFILWQGSLPQISPPRLKIPSVVSVSTFFLFCPPLSEAGRFQQVEVDTLLPQENVKSTSL